MSSSPALSQVTSFQRQDLKITTVGDGSSVPLSSRLSILSSEPGTPNCCVQKTSGIGDSAPNLRDGEPVPYTQMFPSAPNIKATDTILSVICGFCFLMFWPRQCWAMLSPRFAHLLSTRMGPVLGKRRNDRPHPETANFSGFAKQNCANAARKGKFAGSKAAASYSRSFFNEMLLTFDPSLRRPKTF